VPNRVKDWKNFEVEDKGKHVHCAKEKLLA